MLVHTTRFRSKAQCLDFFREMLAGYGPGEVVSEIHRPFLESLLSEYHADPERKIGCGIRGFRVEQDPVWKKNKCFLIVRTDGSEEDFSYVKCINRPVDQHRSNVIKAMRSDIYDQIRLFRDEAYGNKKYVRCGITNLNVRKQDCHVDHVPPKTFTLLASDYLRMRGLKLRDVLVASVRGSDEVSPLTLADPDLRSGWKLFHAERAELRITLDHANLGQRRTRVAFVGQE